MEYEKIEEILSKLKKEIAYLNNDSCDLYGLVEKSKNKQFVSYSKWCLEFLARNINGIHSCCLFIERLVKDMNKETNNAEYTYKDIIIDPTSEEAKNAVGKECYFGDNPTFCLNNANKNSNPRILTEIPDNGYFRFKSKNMYWGCIIVKKEESYEERAKKWIEQNDLKEGDYVKVTRKVNDHEYEWQGIWFDYMDESVGKTLKVKDIDTYVYTISLENGFYYPYFVLEKTEPIKPEYVPFKSIEEFVERYTEVKEGVEFGTFEDNLLQCGVWIKSKDDDDLSQVTVIKEYGICIDTMSTIVLWKNLLDDFEFIDGTPCGKLVEEESNA